MARHDSGILETGQQQRKLASPALKNAGDFSGQVMTINSVAFSQDGRLIATGSGDQTTRVWDVATGKMMKQLGQVYTLPKEPLTKYGDLDSLFPRWPSGFDCQCLRPGRATLGCYDWQTSA